ncbi:MAG: transposase [Deltaproteobacteria bacterium]|jgi:transposase|nr:transposase [Deltaproteobacteria bacterium]
MATVICRELSGKMTILGVVAYRRESDKKPTSTSVTLGYIDSKTHKPVYNAKFLDWVYSNNLDPDTCLKDFLERTNKNITIDFSGHLNNYLPPTPSSNNALYQQTKTIDTKNNNTAITKDNILLDKEIELFNKIKTSKKCFYGSIYLLNYIYTSIGLKDILTQIFLDDAEKIKNIIFFNIIEHKPLMYCKTFVQNYDIPLTPSELASQRISEILNNISEQDRLRFYSLWSKKINSKEYLVFDSTSISSYYKTLVKSVFGYNTQREKLKQVNLCFIFDEETGLPAFSTVYNGSLPDVTTLVQTITERNIAQHYNLKLVLDRGFYSKRNVDFLVFSPHKTDFIMGLPATTSLYNSLINEHLHILDNYNYAFKHNGDTIFAATKKIMWQNKYLTAYIYVDPTKNDNNRNIVANEILMMYENACKDPQNYVDDPDYSFALKFRRSSKQKGGYIVKINNDAYKAFCSQEGWLILLSNYVKNPKEILEIYQNRDVVYDVVDKAFDILKHFQNKNRTYVQSDDIYESYVFIGFLSMIMISVIHKTMKEHSIYKNRTMDEFLDELSAIKALILDQKYIIDPLTKLTKQYFDYFNCPYPISG